MLVLAVDSSTVRESVALVRGERLLGEVRLDTEDVASRRLLPAAAFLLDAAGVTPAQLDALAVAVGPGSFTGLRVGIATVQGLALAGGRPCVGVSTLAALGQLGAEHGLPVATLLDALRGEVYAALYDAAGGEVLAPRRETLEDFVARTPARALFVGDGAERFGERILALRPGARLRSRPAFLASVVARLGHAALERGEAVPPEELRPFYLREAHIRGAAAPSPVEPS